MGQAKTTRAPRSKKSGKKSTSSTVRKKALDDEKPRKTAKKTAVSLRGKRAAAVKKKRSLAARKGWETRRENARVAEEKRKVRSERSKAVWAKRKRDAQLTERRKLLDIRDLRQIADDRIQKLEAKEKAEYAKNYRDLLKAKLVELKKLTRRQLLDTLPDDVRLGIEGKPDKAKVYEIVKIYEGLRIRSFLKGMEKTSEMAGDVMRKFVETKVYGTELEFLQSLDTTRQILFYTGNWEETPDSILFGKLKEAYGTPQFEAVIEVLSNETGHSQRYLYSLFHSPDASVFS